MTSFDRRNPLQLAETENSEDDIGTGDEEQGILREDIEGSRPRPRRNNVKLDYDSDSSEDNATWRDRERQKVEAQQSRDSEDDDMFEDKKPQDAPSLHDKGQARVRFLDVKSFERENIPLDTRVKKHTESDEEDNSGEEFQEDMSYYTNPEEHATKEKPRSVKIEAFNLRPELEAGRFDEDGNYIRKAKDEEDHQDVWLQGISKQDIRRARYASQRRHQTEESRNPQVHAKADLIGALVQLIEVGETSLEALQRLNKQRKSKQDKSARYDTDAEIVDAIEKVSDLCDNLLAEGVSDIYEMSRAQLSRLYQQETGHPLDDMSIAGVKRKRVDTFEASSRDQQELWEYRWQDSDEIFGPFTREEMTAWAAGDFFDERVSLRRAGSAELEFKQYSADMFVDTH